MKKISLVKRISALTAVLVLVPCLAACAAVSKDALTDADVSYGMMMDTMDSAPVEYEYSYAENYDKVADDGLITGNYTSGSSAAGQDGTVSTPAAGRKLIKTVTMELETREFESFIQQMNDRVAAAGGYIESSSVDGGRYSSNSYYTRNASVTARIPAERLDDFCSGIAGISNVVYRHENTSDVTLRYYDTESHMKALQSEYETLVGILEKCTKLEDVISVQRRITEVLYQIESNKTTLNNYDSLVAYSTVTMRIEEVKEETVVTEQTVGQRISHGLKGTMRDIREDAEDMLVWFAANLPYLLIWGVVIAAAVLVARGLIRRSRRKRAARKTPAAVQAEPPKNEQNP